MEEIKNILYTIKVLFGLILFTFAWIDERLTLFGFDSRYRVFSFCEFVVSARSWLCIQNNLQIIKIGRRNEIIQSAFLSDKFINCTRPHADDCFYNRTSFVCAWIYLVFGRFQLTLRVTHFLIILLYQSFPWNEIQRGEISLNKFFVELMLKIIKTSRRNFDGDDPLLSLYCFKK